MPPFIVTQSRASLIPIILPTEHGCSSPTGILSDPDKRRKYDVGGFDSLDTTDREIHVDLSSLGVIPTAVAALFTKLGEIAVSDVHSHPCLMLLHTHHTHAQQREYQQQGIPACCLARPISGQCLRDKEAVFARE